MFLFILKISEIEVSNFDDGKIGFPVPTKTPYRKIVSMCLMKVRETGIIYKEQIASLTNMPNCYEVSLFSSANFLDVFTAFAVILTGMLISLLIRK